MKLKFKDKTFYGVGNLSYSVVSQTITNFFMFFGTSVLKMPGTLIGLAIALSTVWDGFSDPIVGYISDNKKLGKLGYRHGYMLIATFGMALLNIFIWCVPSSIDNAVKFIWITIGLICIETFNTLFATPYSALGTELTSDYHERTVVQIYKTLFYLFGMIIPSVLMFIFLPNTPEFPQGQLNPTGYKYIAMVTSILCVVSGLLCVFGTLKFKHDTFNIHKLLKSKFAYLSTSKTKLEKHRYKILNSKKHEKNKVWKNLCGMMREFVSCFKNKNQRIIIMGYSISLISATFLTSVGLHFFTYCFNYSTAQITSLLLCLVMGMILSQPVWFKLSEKKDKKPALLLGMLLAICSVFVIIIVYLAKRLLMGSTFYIILITIFAIGAGSGALYSLPNSMYSDVIDLANSNNNKNKTATYTGFMTFACNMANAVALLVIGILLDIIQFNPVARLQTRPVQTGITIILFVGVELAFIVAYAIFSGYGIKKKHFKKRDKNENGTRKN